MFSLLCLIKHSTHLPTSLPPPWLVVNDEETASKYRDIIPHGCNAQGKGPQVIANKGQVISPKWSQVQGTTY